MANNIFQAGGGGNWNSTASWSLGSIPTINDGNVARFDATSPNCAVNTASAACNGIDFTGYTNTITMTNGITNNGNITLSAAMTIAGSGNIAISTTSPTITSNGKTWSNGFTVSTSSLTITLADTLTIVNFSSATSGNTTMNGNTINVTGTLTVGGNQLLGTTSLNFTGNNTWTGVGGLTINTNINTAGSFALSGQVAFTGATLTYTTAGSTSFAGSTLRIVTGSTVINTNGVTWNNISMDGSTTTTLSSNLTCSGNYTWTSGAGTLTGNTLLVGGNLIMTGGSLGGTTAITINGTCTWSGAGVINKNLTFNTAGAVTISGSVFFGTGTLTITAVGSFTSTGSTLTLGNSTVNVNGFTWNNVSTNIVSGSLTFTSNMQMSGSWTQLNTANIAGSPTITIGGGCRFDAITGAGSVWIMNGTGTYRGVQPPSSSMTFNTAGTITMSTAQTNALINFTHTAGTVITTSTTTAIEGTYSGGSINWNNVNIVGVNTTTLSTDINIGGNFLYGSLGQVTTINGAFNVNVSGNFTMGGTSSTTSGTASIRLVGTGTINSTQTTNGLRNNLIIASTNYTLVALRYSGGTITNTAAAVFTSGTLTLHDSSTLNTSVSWFNIVPLTGIITINQLLTATGTITMGATGTVTFAGTHGFTTANLLCTTAGRTINYAAGKTYTITTSLISTGTLASKISFVSTNSGTGAIFTLQSGATQDVTFTNGTWMDSSGGLTVLTTPDSTLSNTINWNFRPSTNFFLFM